MVDSDAHGESLLDWSDGGFDRDARVEITDQQDDVPAPSIRPLDLAPHWSQPVQPEKATSLHRQFSPRYGADYRDDDQRRR